MTRAVDVIVREVGPRDGLQSASNILALGEKTRLVRDLAASGIARIEAGSFVSPRAVPSMADTPELLTAVRDLEGIEVLVVNRRGAADAAGSPAATLVALLAASETFAARNVRMSVDEGVAQLPDIVAMARDAGKDCVATVSAVFGCAYEGAVPASAVQHVVDGAARSGVTEVMLCDTVGMASPGAVESLLETLLDTFGSAVTFGLHFHDTRGLGLANVMAGLDAGIRLFDASVGGLGGCPFAPGATGNICTEDLVHVLELEGYQTGVDLVALADVARDLERALGVSLPGRVLRAGPSWAVGTVALAR